MKIDVRHASHPDAVRGYDTDTLRRHFLVETVFEGGEIRLTYSHYDRMVIGGAMPLGSALDADSTGGDRSGDVPRRA